MHRYLCFLLLFLILGSNSFGQVPENINTDRPDQSDGTYIVSKNIFQLETGLVFSADGIIHNTMLRYGIVKNTELRLLFNYGEVNTTGKRETGIFPVSFSIKHKLVEGKRFIPQITAVGYVQFPFLSTTG